jgi:hypothetical protein
MWKKVDVRGGIVVAGSCKMHAWYMSGTATSYWSTKRGFRPQQSISRAVEGLERGIAWPILPIFSLSNSLGLLTSSIHRVSVSWSHSLTLSLPLCLSPPLFPRVLLSDDCRPCLVTITLSLCNTRNSAAWTIAITIPPPNNIRMQ